MPQIVEARAGWELRRRDRLLAVVDQCRSEADVEEERRVLYVGMTRAKRRLCLSHVRKSKGYTKQLSPFLDGISDELLIHRVIREATESGGGRLRAR